MHDCSCPARKGKPQQVRRSRWSIQDFARSGCCASDSAAMVARRYKGPSKPEAPLHSAASVRDHCSGLAPRLASHSSTATGGTWSLRFVPRTPLVDVGARHGRTDDHRSDGLHVHAHGRLAPVTIQYRDRRSHPRGLALPAPGDRDQRGQRLRGHSWGGRSGCPRYPAGIGPFRCGRSRWISIPFRPGTSYVCRSLPGCLPLGKSS